MTLEPMLKQKEAARLLRVSESWLRASECPKILLPGNGPKRRPVVRYRMSDIEAWSEKQRVKSTMKRAG